MLRFEILSKHGGRRQKYREKEESFTAECCEVCSKCQCYFVLGFYAR